jgi:hypothetical protein
VLGFAQRASFCLTFIWLVYYISDMSSDRIQTQRRRRRLREQLRALSFEPLMRGSLVERLRRCGRANCACAHDPRRRHGGKFLTVEIHGRRHALHVGGEDEPRVQAAIAAYTRLWDLINELTACELSDLSLRRQGRERRRQRRQS